MWCFELQNCFIMAAVGLKHPVLLVCRTAHSIPRFSNKDAVCTDLTSVREPVEAEPNLSQPPFFFFFSDCDLCSGLDTLSSHRVSRDSHVRIALNIQSDFRCVFDGVMTPLMPAGPDAKHMLDPSSMSVVIVIVIAVGLRHLHQQPVSSEMARGRDGVGD